MRIRVALPKADADKLRAKIVESAEKVETVSCWECCERFQYGDPLPAVSEL